MSPSGPADPCSCPVVSIPTPAGAVTLVQVFGDLDLTTHHLLDSALTEAWRRPHHPLVVDVAGLRFCSVRGLSMLVHAGGGSGGPVDYLLCGVPVAAGRLLAALWPAEALPARYATAGAAVLVAMARQRERQGRAGGVPGHDAPPTERTRRVATYRSALRLLEESADPDDRDHGVTIRLRTALAAFDDTALVDNAIDDDAIDDDAAVGRGRRD